MIPDCRRPHTITMLHFTKIFNRNLLLQCVNAAFHVSDEISTTYFTHSGETKQSVGA